MGLYDDFTQKAGVVVCMMDAQDNANACEQLRRSFFRTDHVRDVNVVGRRFEDPRCVVQPPSAPLAFLDNSGYAVPMPGRFDIPTQTKGFESFVLRNTGTMDACMRPLRATTTSR